MHVLGKVIKGIQQKKNIKMSPKLRETSRFPIDIIYFTVIYIIIKSQIVSSEFKTRSYVLEEKQKVI